MDSQFLESAKITKKWHFYNIKFVNTFRLKHHITHLIVHGVLHIFGFDHIRNSDGDLMEAVEARVMARLGLPNPYDTPEYLGP
jgi:hypothetical protein